MSIFSPVSSAVVLGALTLLMGLIVLMGLFGWFIILF